MTLAQRTGFFVLAVVFLALAVWGVGITKMFDSQTSSMISAGCALASVACGACSIMPS